MKTPKIIVNVIVSGIFTAIVDASGHLTAFERAVIALLMLIALGIADIARGNK